MAEALYKIDKLIHSINNNDINNDDKSNNDKNNNDKKEEMEQKNDSDDITIGSIKKMISSFVCERDWEKYHTPRNLLLALVGEVGELSEIFQWRSDDECKKGLPKFNDADRIHLGEEMADILIYLCRLADVCGVNMKHAVKDKMKKNEKKYPSELVKGSSKKYTHYQ